MLFVYVLLLYYDFRLPLYCTCLLCAKVVAVALTGRHPGAKFLRQLESRPAISSPSRPSPPSWPSTPSSWKCGGGDKIILLTTSLSISSTSSLKMVLPLCVLNRVPGQIHWSENVKLRRESGLKLQAGAKVVGFKRVEDGKGNN